MTPGILDGGKGGYLTSLFNYFLTTVVFSSIAHKRAISGALSAHFLLPCTCLVITETLRRTQENITFYYS